MKLRSPVEDIDGAEWDTVIVCDSFQTEPNGIVKLQMALVQQNWHACVCPPFKEFIPLTLSYDGRPVNLQVLHHQRCIVEALLLLVGQGLPGKTHVPRGLEWLKIVLSIEI